MKKEVILYGVIGLLVGLLVMGVTAAYAVNNEHTGMMRMIGMRSSSNMMQPDHMGNVNHMGMSMDDMSNALKGKTGDEFDKLFIEQMIDHHEGAINMAILAKQSAKHNEIKYLADDIIKAQSAEISQMQSWQKIRGY